MWLVTLEARDGSWLDDPQAADTREAAEELARGHWANQLPEGAAIVLYSCQQVEVLDSD